MSKIVFIPLDERPCNYIYPDYIGRMSGLELSMPPKEILGDFKKEADVEAVWEWTKGQVKGASHLVVSMDMLLYGGIVPSRLHHLPDAVCAKRLERLKEIKKLEPGIQIYGFQLITRAPARDGSGEEPDYYEDYGYRIFRYGVIRDKESVKAASLEELEELETICREVPEEYLNDFLERRRINFNNHIRSIELVEEGVIDYMIIPLDDCREYGYAPSERKKLSSVMAKKNLLSRIAMYPGADEIGCTLLARAVNGQSGLAPAVYVDYSSLRGKTQIPSYEDRSIGETVLSHLLAAGCGEAETSAEADFVLAVNPPTPFSLKLDMEILTDDLILESERNLSAFLARIRKYRKKGLAVGIADCAIPNGADRALMQFLYEQDMLKELAAYGGWNTSSNTLGTVLSHLCAWNAAEKLGRLSEAVRDASEEFLFFRYLEDWGYMAEVRRDVTDHLTDIDPALNRLDLRDKEPVVRKIVKKRLEEFQAKYFPQEPYRFDLWMPWNRMFEVEIHLDYIDEL